MRYLCFFTLGFAGVLGLCAYVLGAFPMGALSGALLFAALFPIFRKKDQGKKVLLILAGAILAFLSYWAFDSWILAPIRSFDGEVLTTEITLREAPGPGRFGSRAEGRMTLAGKNYGVRVFFIKKEDLRAGDRVLGSFRLELPEKQKFSGAGEGIYLSAFQKGALHRFRQEEPGLRDLPGRIRSFSQSVISWCFPEHTAPFARALLLGDTNPLNFTEKWDLRVSGIRHLVAVSGLHVSILCLLLRFLTFKNRWLSAFLSLPMLVLFGAVTGFSPSVLRASIMMGFLILGRLLDRRYDPLTELSGAVLLMLIGNPMTITSVSFQLSAASVLGILLFYGKIRSGLLTHLGRRKGLRKKVSLVLADSLGVSLSSLIFVTPLCGAYFGSVSLIGPITNLLVVWITPFLFGGILLTVVLGAFSLGAASLLGSVVSWGISYVLGVSHLLSRIPLAAIYLKNPIMILSLVSIYLLGFFCFLRGRKQVRLFLEGTVLSLLICLGISWFLPFGTSVTVLDVGQGQSVLLSSQGRNYLVDCGGSREEDAAILAAETLLSRGVRRLDGLILTHFDYDHVGGADELLTVIPTDFIYLPPAKDLPKDPKIYPVEEEKQISFGTSCLTIYPSESQEDSNESGLCVLLDSRDYDILITGDRSVKGEKLLLENHRIPRVDCLVAGHHGAADSTGTELLKAVRPDTVVISAGRKNRYGHPAGETLLRLQQFGCKVLRTDLQGTVTLRR